MGDVPFGVRTPVYSNCNTQCSRVLHTVVDRIDDYSVCLLSEHFDIDFQRIVVRIVHIGQVSAQRPAVQVFSPSSAPQGDPSTER